MGTKPRATLAEPVLELAEKQHNLAAPLDQFGEGLGDELEEEQEFDSDLRLEDDEDGELGQEGAQLVHEGDNRDGRAVVDHLAQQAHTARVGGRRHAYFI